jgi:HlyD family secretion protein
MAQSVAAPAVPEVKEKRKFNPKIFLGIAAVAIGGYFLWRQFLPAPVPQILTFTGRIEADETDIGAKTGGRIAEILVEEGDTVKIGQIVAVIERFAAVPTFNLRPLSPPVKKVKKGTTKR